MTAHYDFKSLSSFDFERLVRDLLQKELGIFLESFKQGKDRGIDLRYARNPNRADLIVQCKHYAVSGLRALLQHLRTSEAPKLSKLNPKRYLLATSVPLSPQDKSAIQEVFSSSCLAASDVLGCDDLNNMLGRNPSVEKDHYKLWLTSSNVLDRLLNSRIYTESRLEYERILRRLALYVQNDAYFDAQRKLSAHRFCVIAGVPGIGKSTLAEMLLLDHTAREFEPFIISQDIRDALAVFRPEQKQFFYYDDFLGQTGLTALAKNEEHSLLRFIDAVRHSKSTRLVLTTREYILQQAMHSHERLDTSGIDLAKCVVRLDSYGKNSKAALLLNHLYFSHLPRDHVAFLVQSGAYLEIINHANYSPRIIEWMTDSPATACLPADEYPRAFLQSLAHPKSIWDHAYRRHLHDAARSLLTLLATLPEPVLLEPLRQAFDSFFPFVASRLGLQRHPSDFNDAVKECEGTFIVSERHGYHQQQVLAVRLHNPSIRDYLNDLLDGEEGSFLQAILATTTLFENVEALIERKGGLQSVWLRDNAKGVTGALLRTLHGPACSLKKIDERSHFYSLEQASVEKRAAFLLAVGLACPEAERRYAVEGIYNVLMTALESGNLILADCDQVVLRLSECRELLGSRVDSFLAEVKRQVFQDLSGLDELLVSNEILDCAPTLITEQDRELMLELTLHLAKEASSRSYSCTVDDFNYVVEVLEIMEGGLGADLSYEKEQVRLVVKEIEEEAAERAEEEYDSWTESRTEADYEDSELRAMFESLSEEPPPNEGEDSSTH